MVNGKSDYEDGKVQAAKRILMDVSQILGDYKKDIVIIGGWIPSLYFPNAVESYVGSLDVDIALNHHKIDDSHYRRILDILQKNGYVEKDQPFQFIKDISIAGKTYPVELDLLAGEYGGRGKTHRTQAVQDIRPRKARGVDLSFENYSEIEVTGLMPDGTPNTIKINAVTIPVFILLKCFAMDGRDKAKDAWDIYYCLKQNPTGTAVIATQLRELLPNRLISQALDILDMKFPNENGFGPNRTADFEETQDSEQREIIKRDAFERVSDLFKKIHQGNK